MDAQTASRVTTYAFSVMNTAHFPVVVTRLGGSGPGMELLNATPTPITIAAHGKAEIKATFRVGDCNKVAKGSWPFPVTFQTTQGTSTQFVDLLGAGNGGQWQAAAAEAICHPEGR